LTFQTNFETPSLKILKFLFALVSDGGTMVANLLFGGVVCFCVLFRNSSIFNPIIFLHRIAEHTLVKFVIFSN
ncbi:MAG: hypothetical protein AAF639_23315, partial [Chloroflexota bacterium]